MTRSFPVKRIANRTFFYNINIDQNAHKKDAMHFAAPWKISQFVYVRAMQ